MLATLKDEMISLNGILQHGAGCCCRMQCADCPKHSTV